MKYLIALTLLLVAVFVNQISVSSARSEPVCSYKSMQDDTVFLKYLPYSKKGEDYVDFGPNGICVKKATCTETFLTEVDECNNYPVNCNNRKQYAGVFPACCVKC